ncbi:MAG: PLP-dependent aminotransferase family protein [Chloroflexota bacterium]
MGLSLNINRRAGQPLYRQIAEQIRTQIRDGRLPVGTRLPPIRTLAADFGVTRPTVESAYDELRADGWVETAVGRGTFVAREAAADEVIQSLGFNLTPTGVLLDMPRIESVATLRSLAYAEPDLNLFPLDDMLGSLNHMRRADAVDILRYAPTQGDAALRIELVNLLRDRGLETVPENIIVTTGATQGLSLVMQALLDRGDHVVVEEPTHICLLNAIKAFGLNPVGVPMDEDGVKIDKLERIFTQYRPRVFYTVPNYQNPTGAVMSQYRREKLLALAKQYGVIIVEDDVYGVLSYDNVVPPALKTLDTEDLVVYVTSASKTLANGMRLGYMVAPEPLHEHILRLKYGTDISTPMLTQRIFLQLIQSGRYKTHLKRVVPLYAERRDAALRALRTHMPAGATWSAPGGGLSIWVTLPDGVDSATVHRNALRQGFAFTPGDAFFVCNKPNAHIRICFGAHNPYVLEEAVRVLAQVVRDEQAAGKTPPYISPQ